MSPTKTICVVTGSRAEYGLLSGVMRQIQTSEGLRLQVAVTGMHLAPAFGSTWRQIESDGFPIDAKVDMLLDSDTAVGNTKSLGLAVIGFADAWNRLRPDLVVVLGDRFEILAAVQAALLARIPVAHIHGGETSEGAFDEGIRHAITKMSHWHFVAAEPYRRRVIQMGEDPERVFNVGAPGLDDLSALASLSRTELEKSLEMRLGSPLFLVTYHPATLGSLSPESAMTELLAALDRFPNATIVFTHPNADAGGRSLTSQIDAFVARNQARSRSFVSLGQRRYLSLMREADVVVGNSSSGLTEAPALKRATVNIGERQNGRLKATSVLDAAESRDSITAAIQTALSDPFQSSLSDTVSLYGCGQASRAIVDQLKAGLPELRKRFFDREWVD